MTNILILGMTEFFIVLFAVLAYMIKYKGRVDIIAGYDEKQVRNKSGLANFVGNNLIILAVSALLVFIFELLNLSTEFLAFLVFASVIVPILGIGTFLGMRKYLVIPTPASP
ncbi:MAG: DUF3784 domain-containing protein [Methanomicrobiales archaeon]|nr:DUF3784 domain-containing protein [Methanomicrobiales archaeon]